MEINLVVADDHRIVLEGLVQLFAAQSDFNVVAECVNGDEALQAVYQFEPDILVLDMSMPVRDGLSVLRELSAKKTSTQSVLLTAALDDNEVLEAIQLGVRGVVLKEMAPEMLVQCVRKVHAGGEWLEKESVGRALQKLIHDRAASANAAKILTAREIDIVKHAAKGLRNREIAETLYVTEGTVKTHLHNIYEKLSIRGRTELIRYARDHALL